MILVVAEKPSVGRDIARVLGCEGKGEGCIRGKNYIVTWALGHLVSLCEPDQLDPAYKRWRMEQLPMLPQRLPTRVLPKTQAQYAVVKALMLDQGVEKIICATDSGREGELIFRFIYHQAGCKKPVDRLWISSMTDAAIREGFARLKPDGAYDALYVSARCRAEADWLVGMNATRAFSLKYGALLSLGRVQTPTLNLIAQRDKEIREFVPQEYYEIRADFGDYQGLWLDPEKKEPRCMDGELAQKICAQVRGQTGRVAQLRQEKKRTPPPQLFDLTALQREANRLMGLSAAQTLDIAQALYERHKLITYPRTDSRYLPGDMAPKVRQTLEHMPAPYAAWAKPLLPKPPMPGRVYNDGKVSDHHAIVPTGQFAAMGRLSQGEAQVMDMICRRLLAALYPDYEYLSTQVITQVGPHSFRTQGQTPLAEGWRALYREEKAQGKGAKGEKEEAQAKLPALQEGDTRKVEKVGKKRCKTKPPAPHTDASLLGLMEHAGRMIEDEALRESMKESGLGTPATRAAILERLIQVGYVVRKGKTLTATDKGLKLVQVAPQELASPETTGKWERSLSRMAREEDPEKLRERSGQFMGSIRRFSAFLVEAAKAADAQVRFAAEEPRPKKGGAPKVSALGRPCPLCGQGEVTANQKAFGCSRWREGCRFTIWRDALTRQGGPSLTVNHMKKLLDGQTLTLDGLAVSLAQGRLQARRDDPPAGKA